MIPIVHITRRKGGVLMHSAGYYLNDGPHWIEIANSFNSLTNTFEGVERITDDDLMQLDPIGSFTPGMGLRQVV